MPEQVPFQPIHGLMLMDHAAQNMPLRMDWGAVIDKWNSIAQEPDTQAFSGLDGGDVLVCAGIITQWPGRAVVWGMVSGGVTRSQMVWVHRRALVWLDQMQDGGEFRRLETTARCDHPQAQRWLEMLGFQCEGRLRCYDADGNDHKLYSRIACPSTPPKLPPSDP